MIDLGKCKICETDLSKKHTFWISNDNESIRNCNICHDSLQSQNYTYHDSASYKTLIMLEMIIKRLEKLESL